MVVVSCMMRLAFVSICPRVLTGIPGFFTTVGPSYSLPSVKLKDFGLMSICANTSGLQEMPEATEEFVHPSFLRDEHSLPGSLWCG